MNKIMEGCLIFILQFSHKSVIVLIIESSGQPRSDPVPPGPGLMPSLPLQNNSGRDYVFLLGSSLHLMNLLQ